MSKAAPQKSTGNYLTLAVLLGFPLLLFVGALSWWVGRTAIGREKLEQQRAELRSRGMPIDDQSLADFRSQRMNKPKSKRWMEVLKKMETKDFLESSAQIPIIGRLENELAFVPGKSYPYEMEVVEFLSNWESLRAEIHDITENSEAIWTHTEFNSFSTLLPYVQNCRPVALLLSLELEDAIRRNDRDQVFHSLMAMIGTARTLEGEPIIISQLVHIALLSMALNYVKQSVELNLLNEMQLLSILEQLKSQDDFDAKFRLAIAGERAMSQAAFDDPSQFGKENVAGMVGSRPIDALASLQILSRVESLQTDDLRDFLLAVLKLESELRSDLMKGGWLHNFDTKLTQHSTPAWGAYGVAVARSAMELRIAKLAIGLRLFELRNGRWPNSLGELTDDAAF